MDKYLVANWPAPQNVVAITTLRNTNDAHTAILPNEPIWLKQVHGNTVVLADAAYNQPPQADAAITYKSNVVCAVRTADCLPILICDQQGTQVAAIHAGWRGLAAGIVTNTCRQFSVPLQNCLVWLGPAIGAQAFEVGADVLATFAAQGWQQKQINAAFIPHTNVAQKWLGNLYALARFTLQEQGICADNIYGGEWCTYSDPESFYSYRRSPCDSGRMYSLIWLR